MSVFFEIQDPRGRAIVCQETVWFNHILSNRPFMAGWEEEVKQAIRRPRLGIDQDAVFPERQIYYGFSSGKERYMKVVVQFSDDQHGEVITAFPTGRAKQGETLIWPSSNP